MPREFSPSTAESVVAAVEAVVVNKQPTSVAFAASFSDISAAQAEAALKLATDIGFLSCNAGNYSLGSPLCRHLATPHQMQRAAALRILLEAYPPFVTFRERLVATALADTAAQQTKVALELDAHREAIKDTLISLGTYSNTLESKGGGRYQPKEVPIKNSLETLAGACSDMVAAEARIRIQLGVDASAIASREEVIIPLADGLLKAGAKDARGSVLNAGNAVESYLVGFAARQGVNIAGANGINAKLDRLAHAGHVPSKLLNFGKYVGHVRNAADHGNDQEVGAAWTIRPATGYEYVFTACSFIAAIRARELGKAPEI